MELKPEIIDRIKRLEKKYAAAGQDLSSYLDGLLYADYLTYWDYINLDTLLTLQQPKTSFPDENVFIIYHQITELYFKLVLHELEQLAETEKLSGDEFLERTIRIDRYVEALVNSFDIMVDGMDKDQFLKFRMSLLPASGFQSAQFRMIEICCTNLENLVKSEHKETYQGEIADAQWENSFQHLYWKEGATELSSGEKTLTLKQFEEKYEQEFIQLAKRFQEKNLYQLYLDLPEKDQQREDIQQRLRRLDVNFNINWALAHYRSAARYLQKDPEDIAATGGTNWQKYLPPRFQKIIFFPKLWKEEEVKEWGKGWVRKHVLGQS